MTALAKVLFVGPAVVVDDEVDQPDTEAQAVIRELEGANIPVFKRRDIPPDEEIVHWQAMSLIVLDWDLLGTMRLANDGLVDKGDVGEESPMGLVVPDSLRQDPRIDSLRFVKKLMKDLYCPIFIISNHDVSSIWKNLETDLTPDDIEQLQARVLVKSKSQIDGALLESLNEWVSKHPAIYALKTWERGYEKAKSALFGDFQKSAVEWPGILWHTSEHDGVNPNYDLAETISRNLLHRMDPHLFDPDLIAPHGDPESLDSVRRVLHQQAVLPVSRLHSDVLMPGDFFYDACPDSVPQHIEICLTPACDLVARGEALQEVRMFMVRATRIPDSELETQKALRKVLESDSSTTSVLLHHITPEDAMYRVRFRDWTVTTWGEVKERRRGRLLEPYITLLQQRNALFSQRQGLPRLPKAFYQPRQAAD